MPVDHGGFEKRDLTATVNFAKDPGMEEALNLFKEQFGGQQSIKCVQYWGPGNYQITFASQGYIENAAKNGVRSGDQVHAVKPVGAPFTWVTVKGAPYETTKQRINNVLADYGVVTYHEYEYPEEYNGWTNGNRRLKIEMKRPVPNLIKVGPYLLTVVYRGVVKQCRRCLQPGHFANQCQGQPSQKGQHVNNETETVREDEWTVVGGKKNENRPADSREATRPVTSYADLFRPLEPVSPMEKGPPQLPLAKSDFSNNGPLDRPVISTGRYDALPDEGDEEAIFGKKRNKNAGKKEGESLQKENTEVKVLETEKNTPKRQRISNEKSISPKKRNRTQSGKKETAEKEGEKNNVEERSQTVKPLAEVISPEICDAMQRQLDDAEGRREEIDKREREARARNRQTRRRVPLAERSPSQQLDHRTRLKSDTSTPSGPWQGDMGPPVTSKVKSSRPGGKAVFSGAEGSSSGEIGSSGVTVGASVRQKSEVSRDASTSQQEEGTELPAHVSEMTQHEFLNLLDDLDNM